jgi:hypothetical protein
LNSNRATIGRSNKTAIEKLGEILCIDFLCVELIAKSAMELAKGGGDRERAKVWKERETLTNIELITHILRFYVTSMFFLKCSYFEDSMLSNIGP